MWIAQGTEFSIQAVYRNIAWRTTTSKSHFFWCVCVIEAMYRHIALMAATFKSHFVFASHVSYTRHGVQYQSGVQTHRLDAHGTAFGIESVYRHLASRTTTRKPRFLFSCHVGLDKARSSASKRCTDTSLVF